MKSVHRSGYPLVLQVEAGIAYSTGFQVCWLNGASIGMTTAIELYASAEQLFRKFGFCIEQRYLRNQQYALL